MTMAVVAAEPGCCYCSIHWSYGALAATDDWPHAEWASVAEVAQTTVDRVPQSDAEEVQDEAPPPLSVGVAAVSGFGSPVVPLPPPLVVPVVVPPSSERLPGLLGFAGSFAGACPRQSLG